MDNVLPTTDYLNDDQSWLGSEIGTDNCRTITLALDHADFDEATHFPDGFVPSGMPLRKVDDAPVLYGPYVMAADTNETQVITRTATGGTADFVFDGSDPVTGAVVAATTAAQVHEILEDVDGIDPGDVDVEGAAGGPFTVEFTGKFADTDVPLLEIDDTDATGGTVLVAAGVVGAGDFEGHLFQPVRVRDGATRATGALFWTGVVKRARLPIDVDAAAVASARGSIRFE